jgi:rhodanese-related sulfurtransferase
VHFRQFYAASILKRHDFAALYNVTGGTGAWIASGYDVVTPAIRR